MTENGFFSSQWKTIRVEHSKVLDDFFTLLFFIDLIRENPKNAENVIN